jgi:hypothetical protein
MPKLVDSVGDEIGTNDNPIAVSKLKKATTYGTYFFHSGVLSVVASAHAGTVGYIYMYNPVASAKTVRIAYLKLQSGMTTALATPTAPRITVEKGTFTGTPSGTQIPVAKGRATDASSVLYISAASTGAVNGALTPVGGKLVDANATGTANTNSSEAIICPVGEDLRDIELAPGEYLCIRQADAGTTSDTRKAIADMVYEEYI